MTTKKTKATAKKRALPADYLAGTVETREAAHAPTPAPAPAAEPQAQQKVTTYMPTALLLELRAASRALAGAPLFCAGPSELVQQAVAAHLAALAKKHNAGKPFADTAPTKALRGNPSYRRRG